MVTEVSLHRHKAFNWNSVWVHIAVYDRSREKWLARCIQLAITRFFPVVIMGCVGIVVRQGIRPGGGPGVGDLIGRYGENRHNHIIRGWVEWGIAVEAVTKSGIGAEWRIGQRGKNTGCIEIEIETGLG